MQFYQHVTIFHLTCKYFFVHILHQSIKVNFGLAQKIAQLKVNSCFTDSSFVRTTGSEIKLSCAENLFTKLNTNIWISIFQNTKLLFMSFMK